MKQDILMKAGLTKNESKVYLALLDLKIATAVEITRKAGVHRVNCYDVLERLREKGLISSIMKAKKRVYEVADPKQLMTLIKEKEEALNEIMPALQQEFKLQRTEQKVYHFLGPEGVMQAYFMILEQNSTLYAMGGSGLNRKYLKHRHELFDKERRKKGFGIKGLYYESVRESKEAEMVRDTTLEFRFLPDKYKTLCMVDFCGNLVLNLIPIENNIMAIVIENKVLADTYRKMFDFMWDNAKK
jgi:sugar-specific transcriptional regulator TrmB